MKRKLKAALDAIDAVFADTSASSEETLDAMLEIEDVVENKIECLRSDIKLCIKLGDY